MLASVVSNRKNCRLCESFDVEIAFTMKPSPIGDAYVSEAELSEKQDCYPLSLYLCKRCGHLQLPTVIDPKFLFCNYLYQTTTSPGLVAHFDDYVDSVLKKIPCSKNSFIVEIGSNDGSLLKFFKNNGMKVLGIDPAREIANQATEKGIETIPEFFNFELAKKIKERCGSAAIVAANNVFAHSDNLRDMAKGIQYLLAPEGVFIFEVSYLVDIISKKLFDTIYHEHLCYHHVSSLNYFLNLYGITLFDVQRIPSKGGSIRCFAKLQNSTRKIEPSVEELMILENAMGLGKKETYQLFEKEVKVIKENVISFLKELKSQKKSIAGYGASPTVTTLIYQFELAPYLDFLVDDNPIKRNRYSPGHHIPVYSSQIVYEKKPDYIIVLAWQYAEMIIKKHHPYLEDGGAFIVPLPVLKCYDKNGLLTCSKNTTTQIKKL